MQRALWVVVLLLACLIGCDQGGVKRHALSGTVTFMGEPIPYGRISFRPDRENGGSGPAGFAQIAEGVYDTRESGKGAVSGPIQVAIEGFESNKPMSPALFPPYTVTMTVEGKQKELNFDVPAEARPKGFRSATAEGMP